MCRNDAAGFSAEMWGRPILRSLLESAVIDLRAIGREAVHDFVAVVVGELQRLAAGCEYDENLDLLRDGRAECDGVAVGRKPGAVHGLIPLADLRDFRGAAGSMSSRPRNDRPRRRPRREPRWRSRRELNICWRRWSRRAARWRC